MTARERLDAWARLGVILSLGPQGELRVSGPEGIVVAARPALKAHRAELREELQRGPEYAH
jgi:hypothetical protein